MSRGLSHVLDDLAEELLYRFKTHRVVSDLQIYNISYAAWKYSLITPPSTFRR